MAAGASSDGGGKLGRRITAGTRREAIRAAARARSKGLRANAGPARRAGVAAGGVGAQRPPPIFISYSHADMAVVQRLVDRLRAGGATVNWDQDFIGGEDFDRAILEAIEAARCVIVVWSATSATSHYVRDEARLAQKGSKLVTTYVAGFDLARVPLGFGSLHAIPVDDAARLRASLAARGIALGG
jgi:hypothetical protein